MFKFSKLALVGLFFFVTQAVVAEEKASSEQALYSSLAVKSLLLASYQYGRLNVVVGERGHILYSSDPKYWVQAKVETNVTLTNVYLLNEQMGWAVGHDAVILKTNDGAKTWEKVFSDKKEEAPLLDVYFNDELNGLAIGAYGLIYTTADGGMNWQKEALNILTNDKESTSGYNEAYDFHLNAIEQADNHRLYIAAEAGHILRSDDGGDSWQELPSPYRGSFFGILAISYEELIVFGLRGHLYRSSDAGKSWEKIETHTQAMLTDARKLSNGDILVTGLEGTLLLSKDNASTFSIVNLSKRDNLSSVLETKHGDLSLVSDAGIRFLSSKQFKSYVNSNAEK